MVQTSPKAALDSGSPALGLAPCPEDSLLFGLLPQVLRMSAFSFLWSTVQDTDFIFRPVITVVRFIVERVLTCSFVLAVGTHQLTGRKKQSYFFVLSKLASVAAHKMISNLQDQASASCLKHTIFRNVVFPY